MSVLIAAAQSESKLFYTCIGSKEHTHNSQPAAVPLKQLIIFI